MYSAANLMWQSRPVGDVPSQKCGPYVDQKITWNPLNGLGPLGAKVAATFRSATYTETVTTETITLYRVYGGNSPMIGSYWTRTPPAGQLQSMIDSVLDPAWGNTMNNIVKIQCPPGIRIFEGIAAPQGRLVGGGNQVYIPYKNINPNWVIP
jgi:filamentous hemagglutinin